MGLDFDVIKSIIGNLLDQSGLAADKRGLIHGCDLPRDFYPSTIISDMTPELMKTIMAGKSASSYNNTADNGEYTRITTTSVVEMQGRVVTSMLKHHPNFAKVTTWAFLIDTPQDVPVVKACEHAKRVGQAYSNGELRLMGILPEDQYNYLPVDAFGRDAIWAYDMDRLWSTRTMKPLVGKFFMNCLMRAISEVRQESKAIMNVNVLAEGAWPAKGMIVTTMGSKQQDFVYLTERPPGEVDLKFLQYLTPAYGKTFLIRSDDGDYQCIILMHYMRLILSGLWEQEELPTIWIDRTVNPMINSNKNNLFRYVNVQGVLRLIRRAHNLDKINTQKEAQQLASAILAVCVAMVLKKSDFTEPFVESFYDKDAGKKKDDEGGEDEPPLVEVVDNSVRNPGGKKSRAKKTGSDSSGSKAPPFFSVAKVTELSETPQWGKCFHVYMDSTTGYIYLKFDKTALQKVLESQLSIDKKKYPCRLQHFSSNIRKLKWMLDYWCNAAIRINTDTRDSSPSKVPYRYQGVELIEKKSPNGGWKRSPAHGWRMVPCENVENSTIVFHISQEDAALRAALFKENDAQAQQGEYFKVI